MKTRVTITFDRKDGRTGAFFHNEKYQFRCNSKSIANKIIKWFVDEYHLMVLGSIRISSVVLDGYRVN